MQRVLILCTHNSARSQMAEGLTREAARRAGLGCAAVAWGYGCPATLRAQQPDLFFEQPAELLRLLPSPC